MKRKIILFTILASITFGCMSASAVTYNDSKMIQYSNYGTGQSSPVVMNYDRNNQMSPQMYMLQNYSTTYFQNSFSNLLPLTPISITSTNVSPVTTNYGQRTGISYDLNLGSVYGSAEQRGSLVSCIKNMPLTKIGIGRTISELTSYYTNGTDDSNYWSYDSNSSDNIIFRCGNNIITFKTYKTSYGIDVYAEVFYAGQRNLTEAEITTFFADLSNKLYEKEQKEKAEKEAKEKAEASYKNSVVVNGTNSGTIVYNHYN